MDKIRTWIALTAVAAAAVLAGGWFLLVSPKNAEAEALQQQTSTQDLANAQVRTQLEVLRGKAEQLPAKRAELAAVATKLPAEPRLPDLIRALSGAASSAGVELVSVSPGSPTPVTVAAPAPAAPATDPAAPAQPAPAPPAVSPVSALPVTINVVGSFSDVEEFVAALEDLPRALRLTGLAMAPHVEQDQSSGSSPRSGRRPLTTTLNGEVYVLAQAPDVLAAPAAGPPAAAVPGAPAPAAPAPAAPAPAAAAPAPAN